MPPTPIAGPAIVQFRHDTEGRRNCRRKLAAGKTPMEALRALNRRLSDVVHKRMIADAARLAKQYAVDPRPGVNRDEGGPAGGRLSGI